MKYTPLIAEKIPHIKTIAHEPLYIKLIDGNLTRGDYINFLKQDSLFLKHNVMLSKHLLYRFPTESFFKELGEKFLRESNRVSSLCQQHEILLPQNLSPTNQLYQSFLEKNANHASKAECMVQFLPCMLGYIFILEKTPKGENLEKHPYKTWFEIYRKDHSKLHDWIEKAFLNINNITIDRMAACGNIIDQAIEYEKLFARSIVPLAKRNFSRLNDPKNEKWLKSEKELTEHPF